MVGIGWGENGNNRRRFAKKKTKICWWWRRLSHELALGLDYLAHWCVTIIRVPPPKKRSSRSRISFPTPRGQFHLVDQVHFGERVVVVRARNSKVPHTAYYSYEKNAFQVRCWVAAAKKTTGPLLLLPGQRGSKRRRTSSRPSRPSPASSVMERVTVPATVVHHPVLLGAVCMCCGGTGNWE
jgi:hypothetical protein